MLLATLPDDAYLKLLTGQSYPLVNIGGGEDATITEIAETVAAVVGFKGRLRYDTSKPDGTPKKLLDASRIRALGWRPRISLREGVARTYDEAVKARLFEAAPSSPP